MKKIVFLMAACFATVMPEAVKAADVESFYASIFGGVDFASDKKKNGVKAEFDTGYVVTGAVGYRFCEGFRVEGEVGYRHNDLDKVTSDSTRVDYGTSSNIHTWSYMANGVYELPVCWSWQPYVGGGIGYSQTTLKLTNSQFSSSSHSNGFAWQVIAGLEYPFLDCWDVAVEYRYFKPYLSHLSNNDIGVTFRTYF